MIKEVVFTGIADGAALLTGEEKEEGVMLLDLAAHNYTRLLFRREHYNMDIILIGSQDKRRI